jgi:hypothetical protein
MPTDGIWRAVARVANVIGIIVALAALGLVGYFASLGLQLMRHGGEVRLPHRVRAEAPGNRLTGRGRPLEVALSGSHLPALPTA